MKNQIRRFITSVILILFGTIDTTGQERNSINPFPINEVGKQRILKENNSIIHFYERKFAGRTLDKWPKPARDSFLIAKARKINILFVPDYYREYNIAPTIETQTSALDHPVYPGALYYNITFYNDPIREKLLSARLIKVSIWNTGEANGFIVPVYDNSGIFFQGPYWEDGKYIEWKKQNKHPYIYITGFENMPKRH
ncbi:hypothetical protein [Sphingobacterium thalpophilum]|jgi:hypothetical protein|uniref:hypothetical protein n=1 Tax=Sphingobacterium thalpophilum TaxID=259 RepID=UPI003C706858